LRNVKRRAMLATDYQRRRAMPRIRQPDPSPYIPGIRQKRPPPPAELDEREAKLWTAITRSLPADWFVASWPLLVELVRHIRIADDLMRDVARARAVIDELRKTSEPSSKLLLEASKQYRALLRLHALQTQRIGTLSTRLRLTPQSRFARSTAHVRAAEDAGVELWDDWEADRPQ
jgi:hypothetical protein